MSFTSLFRVQPFKTLRTDTHLNFLQNQVEDLDPRVGFYGVQVEKSGQSISTGGVNNVSFASQGYDTDAFWDISDPTKIIIPAGVKYVSFDGYIAWPSSSTVTNFTCAFLKNGASFAGRGEVIYDKAFQLPIVTGPIAVTPGDYFQIAVSHATGTTQLLDCVLSMRAWKNSSSPGSISEPYFQPNVRALKGRAPDAGKFNRVARNLDAVNERALPLFCRLRMSTNVVVTGDITIGSSNYSTYTYDTADADPFGLFDGSVINIPSFAKQIRIIENVRLTASSDSDLRVMCQRGYFWTDRNNTLNDRLQVAQGIGYGASGDGVRTMQMDSGWLPTDNSPFGTDISRGTGLVVAYPSCPVTIESNDATWLSVEFL